MNSTPTERLRVKQNRRLVRISVNCSGCTAAGSRVVFQDVWQMNNEKIANGLKRRA